ncbi:CENPE type kinesin-like protein [Chytridium lagenaria]|nr:CENPE type kinesin-like protein [Chytridium lagenaria]
MDGVQVIVRIRPLNSREVNTGDFSLWEACGNEIRSSSSDTKFPTTSFGFDAVFDESSTNGVIYEGAARPLIRSCMDGVNGTIFAYGQTSSGKTHTMQGTKEEPGITILAINDLFRHILNCPDREFLLRVSYLEIYNEVIGDLLQPGNENLKIHEDSVKGVFVGGLTEKIVVSPDDVFRLIKKGEEIRKVGDTAANERSSRSHTVIRVIIESRKRKGTDSSDLLSVRVASLNLVDLAGSERVRYTQAEGIRLKEGSHINKSLLALSNVIGKLSESGDKYVPYRDSKITRILQPSLGGNARTLIVCTITPSNRFWEESQTTLKFASRAKAIRNKPQVNEIVSDETLLKRYKKEIETLKSQLQLVR